MLARCWLGRGGFFRLTRVRKDVLQCHPEVAPTLRGVPDKPVVGWLGLATEASALLSASANSRSFASPPRQRQMQPSPGIPARSEFVTLLNLQEIDAANKQLRSRKTRKRKKVTNSQDDTLEEHFFQHPTIYAGIGVGWFAGLPSAVAE